MKNKIKKTKKQKKPKKEVVHHYKIYVVFVKTQIIQNQL